MIILENGERADPLWGMDTEIITDEMIEALEQGKRLYLSVNGEYAVVIKKDGKRNTDKPEVIRCKDCVYWRHESRGEGYCTDLDNWYDENFYCADAERRIDEDVK